MSVSLKKIVTWANVEHTFDGGVPYIPYDIISALDLPLNYLDMVDEPDIPFSEVNLLTWYCTDTIVGWSVIFFKDTPIALSLQRYRKGENTIMWIPQDGRNMQTEVVEWYLDIIKMSYPRQDMISDMEEKVSIGDILPDENARILANVFDEMENENET